MCHWTVARWVSHVEQELLTLMEHPSSPLVFSEIDVARSLVFYVVLCKSLFVLLYFIFWPLCCLSFNLQLLIIPLVSSNFSWLITNNLIMWQLSTDLRVIMWQLSTDLRVIHCFYCTLISWSQWSKANKNVSTRMLSHSIIHAFVHCK